MRMVVSWKKSCYNQGNKKTVKMRKRIVEVLMGLLIKGGRVIDPDTKLDRIADILIEDGIIQKVGEIEKCQDDRV